MKKLMGLLVLAMATLLFAPLTSTAQKKISRIVKAEHVDVSRGNNPNIRSGAPDVDEAEAKARGTACKIVFSNYTGYFVNVFVDGYYRGQIAPWSGGSVAVKTGYTSIYCITAGKTLEWLDAGNCSGVYTFKLYP